MEAGLSESWWLRTIVVLGIVGSGLRRRHGEDAAGQGTVNRLRDDTFETEMIADRAFAIRAERLLTRLDEPKRKRRVWG